MNKKIRIVILGGPQDGLEVEGPWNTVHVKVAGYALPVHRVGEKRHIASWAERAAIEEEAS
ncbi:hypothetical protein [Isoptericola sp. NPDC056134]|uniref:hypothetical protein n=1 Tax=Isoptericola sp. NPDC056134 TaxID=3345723 RepID=UPI0035EA38FE